MRRRPPRVGCAAEDLEAWRIRAIEPRHREGVEMSVIVLWCLGAWCDELC